MIADPRRFQEKPGVFRPGQMGREELARRAWWTVWAFVAAVLWSLILWAGFALVCWIGG